MLSEKAKAVHPDTGPHDEPIELRQPTEQPSERAGATARTPALDHIEKIGCQPLIHSLHTPPGGSAAGD